MNSIIDGDSYIWKLAYLNDNNTESEVHKNTLNYINRTLNNIPRDNHKIVLGGIGNFRYKIEPEYKAKRQQKYKYHGFVRQIIIDNFNTLIIDGCEADDVIMSYITKYPDALIIHDDKDLLMIPGFHLYRDKYLVVSEVEALLHFYKQLLMGDSTDNIKGIPGIGIKTAEKLLKDVNIVNMMSVILDKYEEYYKEKYLEQFKINYDLIKLKHDIEIT